MTTLSRSLRSPSRFPPLAPFSGNDGKTTEFAPLILFSPRKPRFRRRVRGSQGVFSRRMSGKRRSLILTKRQHPRCAYACSNVFSSRYSFGERRKDKLRRGRKRTSKRSAQRGCCKNAMSVKCLCAAKRSKGSEFSEFSRR